MFLSFAILLYGGVQSKKGRALSVLLFFLALCSYEGVLLTVPVYVAVLYWLLRTHQEGTLEERIGVWNPRVLGGVGAAFLVYVLLRWYSLGAPVRLEPGFVSASYLKDIFEWFADAFSAQIQISGGTPLEGLTAYAWFLFWLAVAWSMRFCVGFYQKSLNEFYRLKQEKQKLVTVETVNDKNYQIFLATMNEQIAHSVKIVSFGRFALWLWGALLLAGFLGTVVVRLWTPKESDLLWGPDLLLFAPLMLGSLLLCLIFMLHMCASVVQYFVAKMDLVKQFNAAVESQEASTEGPKEFVQNARVFKNDASGIVRWSKNGLFIVLTTLSFLAFLQITKGIYATQELKGRWSNDVALWESAYQKDEKSALAVTNYLIALNKTGASLEQLTKVGEPHWEQLAKKESLTRIEAASIATYGALLNEKNEFGKALGMLSLALVKSASEPLLALNLAHIAVQKERWQEALGALNYGLGSYKKTWFNKKQAIAMYGLRAQVYATLGDEKQSKSDLDIANALKKEFSQP